MNMQAFMQVINILVIGEDQGVHLC
jgi:hypothetical protein